jgi:hypothetical protein
MIVDPKNLIIAAVVVDKTIPPDRSFEKKSKVGRSYFFDDKKVLQSEGIY